MTTVKKVFVIELALLFISGSFFSAQFGVLALDPTEEQVMCFENEDGISIEGRPCSLVNCQWRNIAYNWPDETGYSEDCGEGSASAGSSTFALLSLSKQQLSYLFVAIAIVLTASAGIYILRRQRK